MSEQKNGRTLPFLNPKGRRKPPRVTLARQADPEISRLHHAELLGDYADTLMRRAMDEFDREFGG